MSETTAKVQHDKGGGGGPRTQPRQGRGHPRRHLTGDERGKEGGEAMPVKGAGHGSGAGHRGAPEEPHAVGFGPSTG